jgi:DNA modification methylase
MLGQPRLLCGDSTRAEDVSRLMGEDCAALLATDPPYCVGYTGATRPKEGSKDWSSTYREFEIEDLGEFLSAALTATLPHARKNAAIYVWHAHLQYPVIDAVFREFDILRHQPIIWVKPSSTFTYAYNRWGHEPCLFGWRKGFKPPHYLENGLSSVWEVDWEGKQRIVGNEHPTQKPLRLFEIPMEQHTRRGEIVLEPFSGSGSQLIAAEKLGRRCRAMEICPAFVDVAVRRWELATGKQALLDGSGETFAGLAEERAR